MNKITEKELVYISRQFANMFGLSIRVYRDNEKIFYQSTVNFGADPADLCAAPILENVSDIGYHVYNDYFYYAFVRCGCFKTVIGPVSELEYSERETKKLGLALGLPVEAMRGFASEMHSFCGIHLDTLLQIVILYNFSVNRTMYNISDIRIKSENQSTISTEIKENDLSLSSYTDFYKSSSRVISIETDIIKKVSAGDVEGLIEGATKIPAVSTEQLAARPLRHQKNLFIRLVTIASRAAVQAGLEAEEALSVEGKYIMKCESLESSEIIKNLQYHMILDYADRVRKLNKYNARQSKLIRDVTKYIKAHISETIKTSDIAEHLGKNRTNLTVEFKKQTQINLSDYIKQMKIEEAKEILVKTDRVLSEIAYLLGFSSQSHFCRVFKTITGETPSEYRNKNGK